ncbi:MAG TPA: PrsW family intramembrane metalloprotease [Saprospiraceae bacterium]|nr:PrsW family intramembrane metalloprotease [Saprospiraceae bacterium]
MTPLLLLLAILPGLLISWYIYRMDRHEREHRVHLIACFGLGMLLTIPATRLESWSNLLGITYPSSLELRLIVSILVVAVWEEAGKFLVLIAYPFSRPFFNEPIDGIVYAVMIGMGFATLENIFYASQFGLGTTIIRAFTAVPAHALFSVIIGYFAGLAWLHPERKARLLLQGLGIAVAFHAVYDFLVLQRYYDWLMILAVSGLWISIFFAQDLIRRHQDNSPFKPE